jgi:hypothetical protein
MVLGRWWTTTPTTAVEERVLEEYDLEFPYYRTLALTFSASQFQVVF